MVKQYHNSKNKAFIQCQDNVLARTGFSAHTVPIVHSYSMHLFDVYFDSFEYLSFVDTKQKAAIISIAFLKMQFLTHSIPWPFLKLHSMKMQFSTELSKFIIFLGNIFLLPIHYLHFKALYSPRFPL